MMMDDGDDDDDEDDVDDASHGDDGMTVEGSLVTVPYDSDACLYLPAPLSCFGSSSRPWRL